MRRPLTYILIALITGILAGSFCSFSYYALLAAIFLDLFLLLIAVRKKWRFAGFVLILCFTLLAGAFNIQKQNHFIDSHQIISRYIDQGKTTVEGIVTESPIAYPDKNILIVNCMRVVKDKTCLPVSGNIRLVIPPDLAFQYGDFIRFNTNLKSIFNFNNPGGFDYKRYMSLQGIYASGFIRDPSEIILLRKNTAGGMRLKLELFRAYLKQIIYKNAPSPQREIIEAMTIGNQNEIPADVRDHFNKTGTSHILSISGLHIGMVAATSFLIVFFILKSSEYLMLRFNILKVASAAAFIMILFYALIAGMGVTVTRSALMALIFLVALFAGKQKDLYNALILAGLFILAVSPEALFDISFQLSFMAVLALVYIVPRCSNLFPRQADSLPPGVQRILRHLYLSVIVCIAATIGTMPLIMYYFNRVSAVTILANLIAVPLLGTLTLAICMFFILTAFFSPAVAGFAIKVAAFFTQISVTVIDKLASLSWSSFAVGKPTLAEIIFFYLFILLFIRLADEIKNRKENRNFSRLRFLMLQYSLILIILFFTADITFYTFKDKFSSDMKITVIDVGQGNSILVRFPGGENMLVDGGGFSESSFDVGKSVIAPFLYHERINRIDTVALTHPHPDHLWGLIYILNNFDVRQVCKTDLPVDAEEFPEWGKAIQLNHIAVSLLSNHSPEKILNGVAIRVLWPPVHSGKDAVRSDFDEVNDSSLVMKISFGGFSLLIPGDISSGIEKRLIQSGADLKSDILIVPHHGSRHSSSPEFIKATACRYAIVSSGKSNIFKHPHPDVLARYEKAGAKVIRTDRNGAVTIKISGRQLQISTFIKSDS